MPLNDKAKEKLGDSYFGRKEDEKGGESKEVRGSEHKRMKRKESRQSPIKKPEITLPGTEKDDNANTHDQLNEIV